MATRKPALITPDRRGKKGHLFKTGLLRGRKRAVGPGVPLGSYGGKIDLGRRNPKNQTVWPGGPEGIEQRNYNPAQVTLIAPKGVDLTNLKPGDKVATTRRKFAIKKGNLYPGERRTNPNLRKKIHKQTTKN